MPGDIAVDVVRGEDDVDIDVVRLDGSLSLSTMLAAQEAVRKVLADRGRAVVDLSGLRLRWQPAVQLFPAALSTAGGWPSARLVLYGASPELAAQLRASRVSHTVPLAEDLSAASTRLDLRPRRVSRHRDLARRPGSVAGARALLHEVCADWSVPELLEHAKMVVSELVSNALEHAHSSCRVTASLDERTLHIGVRDFGPQRQPRPAPIDIAARRGRGLHLVVALTASWGVAEHRDGKTVWASLRPTA